MDMRVSPLIDLPLYVNQADIFSQQLQSSGQIGNIRLYIRTVSHNLEILSGGGEFHVLQKYEGPRRTDEQF